MSLGRGKFLTSGDRVGSNGVWKYHRDVLDWGRCILTKRGKEWALPTSPSNLIDAGLFEGTRLRGIIQRNLSQPTKDIKRREVSEQKFMKGLEHDSIQRLKTLEDSCHSNVRKKL